VVLRLKSRHEASVAAYRFLVSERETISPSRTDSAKLFKKLTTPETYRARGSAVADGLGTRPPARSLARMVENRQGTCVIAAVLALRARQSEFALCAKDVTIKIRNPLPAG
jgi:hypothetical protein